MRLAIVLGLLLLTAGCLGMAENEGDGNQTDEANASMSDQGEEQEPIEEERTFEASIGSPTVADGRLGIQWPATSPSNLLELELVLAWTEPANRLGLEAETPDGTESVAPAMLPGSTQVSLTLEQATTGSYVFYPTGDGPVAPDDLTLTATFTYAPFTSASSLGEGSPSGGASQDDVETEQLDDGRWRATIEYAATGQADATVRTTLDTVNGAIGLQGGSDGFGAEVTAFAVADTEQQAEKRVRELTVSLQADGGRLLADIHAPERSNGGEDWDQRGAHIQARVPEGSTVTGEADTTNGPIVLEDVVFDGFSADTTNGAIEGNLAGQGQLSLDTTNGAIAVDVDPVANLDLVADTTNGAIELGLLETSDIAYEVYADVTNGDIDESMDEADLQQEDEDGTEATLVTRDGQGRSIQVTGEVDTTNGSIFFQGR